MAKIVTKQLKLNAWFPGYTAGQIIKIRCKDGIPIDRFWRDRLKDSKIDSCVEFVKTPKPKTEGDK